MTRIIHNLCLAIRSDVSFNISLTIDNNSNRIIIVQITNLCLSIFLAMITRCFWLLSLWQEILLKNSIVIFFHHFVSAWWQFLHMFLSIFFMELWSGLCYVVDHAVIPSKAFCHEYWIVINSAKLKTEHVNFFSLGIRLLYISISFLRIQTWFIWHCIICLLGADTVVLEFNQYNPDSRWGKTTISRRDHREEGNEADGFYGGIRKIKSETEISIWKSIWPSEVLD